VLYKKVRANRLGNYFTFRGLLRFTEGGAIYEVDDGDVEFVYKRHTVDM